MKNLSDMVKMNYPVFPFFAVDPRRQGIKEAIVNKKIRVTTFPLFQLLSINFIKVLS